MNEKEMLRAAPREQLNKFIDDLRKELVLNRMHLSEANRQVKALMNRLNDSEKNAEILRQHLIKREESESNLRKEFEKHLLFKDAEVKNLKNILIEKGESKEFSDKEFALQSELEKAKQNYSELELLNRSASFELEVQLRRKDGELEKLRKLLSSKEVMVERLSAEYSKQVNEKDRQIAELNNLIKRNIIEITSAEKYKNLLSIVKEANKKLLLDYKSISKELSDYKRVVEEKDAILREEAKRFREFASEINKRTEERVKDIVKEFSGKEVAIKVELESTRQKLVEQEKTLSAKQCEIDEALDNFALVSQKVLSFKNPEALQMFRENELRELEKQINAKSERISTKEIELKAVLEDIQAKEKGLSEKESQINSLLKNLEGRTNALAQAEEELKGREELLVMQQQAFQKELAMLEDIGFEFKETKERKLEDINAALKIIPKKRMKVSQKTVPKAIKVLKPRTIPVSILRQRLETSEFLRNSDRAQKPVVFDMPEPPELQQPKQEYALEKPAILPKPEAMPETKAEKLSPHEEMFGKDRVGFSELDEIHSMIEVAREHGDSDETIMSSLVSSGYNKEKVEQALKKKMLSEVSK